MPAGILRTGGKYAARAAVQNQAASALSSPLLPPGTDSLSSYEADETSSSSSESPFIPESMTGKDLFSTLAISLLVTGGMAASAAAMIASPVVAVFLMGGICIANSPFVARKHLAIAKSAGIRASVNNIRKEIELIETEIDFLTESVDDLQAETDLLVGIDNALEDIATTQGMNSRQLVELVNENEEILYRMKQNLRQTFVSAMAALVIRSDKDGDMKIDLKEVPLLALSLQIQLDPFGIKLDGKKFESMIRENNDISNVLKFCGEMLFQDDEIDDGSDDNDSVDSEVTFDFEAFCQNLDEEVEARMSLEEKLSMCSVGSQYSGGSVEVARGKRMTLMTRHDKKDLRRQTIVKEVKKRQTRLAVKRASAFENPLDISYRSDTFGNRRLSNISFGSGLVVIKGTSAEC